MHTFECHWGSATNLGWHMISKTYKKMLLKKIDAIVPTFHMHLIFDIQHQYKKFLSVLTFPILLHISTTEEIRQC